VAKRVENLLKSSSEWCPTTPYVSSRLPLAGKWWRNFSTSFQTTVQFKPSEFSGYCMYHFPV